jgi:hypothetical protein
MHCTSDRLPTTDGHTDKAKNLNSVIFTREISVLLSTKSEQLEWRRSKVTELRSVGLSYTEIAQQLQVSRASIGSDLQYIREHAKESFKEYVTEHLPEQYQICLHALDTVLKNAFVIMQKSDDNREKLQALELFKDTHLTKLELLSNATTIDSALNFIRGKQSQSLTQQPSEEKKKDLATDSSGEADDCIKESGSGRQTVF